MALINRINTKIRPFINDGIFRYSHHYQDNQHFDIQHHYSKTFYLPKKILINLLGDRKSVDTASWEINSFAQEKSLNTANIVYDNEMLRIMIYKNNYLQFIVNRCYNMSCNNLLLLNKNILLSRIVWVPYNLYVLPDATNRFNTSEFIRNCEKTNIIVYPLAASEENKRRDINILLDN